MPSALSGAFARARARGSHPALDRARDHAALGAYRGRLLWRGALHDRNALQAALGAALVQALVAVAALFAELRLGKVALDHLRRDERVVEDWRYGFRFIFIGLRVVSRLT